MRLRLAGSVLSLVGLLLTGLGPPAALAVAHPPDVIVIMTDDVPAMDDRVWRYLPTIRDMFVRHGVEFTDFAGETPLCCPGRAGFLTGPAHLQPRRAAQRRASLQSQDDPGDSPP